MLTGVGQICRFVPCCSAYAKEALSTRHLGEALLLIAKRLGRCRPFSAGGYDPLPSIKGGIHGF
ncbi:MAG: membrane protein insertion efficiency factor YidD [Deltaproteobacteria bacterium]|nr:membrane protein insertion efficiency factor YidD [Deltaproteobacteria bacterium]MBI3293740.1 membrane protein insertion efficiency factor YidD [Deltaproteobacteria bacterium]